MTEKSKSMRLPSVHIVWEFTDNPWGGGNQFLKALKKQFIQQDIYRDDPEQADVILFNGHQFQKRALQLKRKYPSKIFVHRIDGPMSLTRGKAGVPTDRKIFYCNNWIADGTIFQSEWSQKESARQGKKNTNRFEACIINAPDPDIFHPPVQRNASITDSRTQLIATSWSSNPKKGFDIYHFLDLNLDFSRYTMTFVGNTDAPFTNITTIGPQPSIQLAKLLRTHDIFIAASLVESCSNSFLEALHCGLPAVARNSSSYPELLNGNGVLFEGENDIIEQINHVASHLNKFRAERNTIHINDITDRYLSFFNEIIEQAATSRYTPKKLSILTYYYARVLLKKQ